jgi:D-serine deaminase-like pyridoxal phosphate-dependent protein
VTAHLIGLHKRDLDTPALCVDLDVMQKNIDAMASWITSRGKQWRPHVKCHKTPAIGHLQMRGGAIGMTAAKVSEAEVFVDAGIPDVLIANMIVGDLKLRRLAALTRRGNPIVAIDHFVQAEALDDVCRQAGTICRMLIEINIGLNRVGVRPGIDARELARGVSKLRHVRLVGIMGYEGHLLNISDAQEKRSKIAAAMDLLMEVKGSIESDGIPLGIVSAGGTGSYQITADSPGITELQAGGGIYADPYYLERCGVTGLEPALRVIASVVSRVKLERAVLDSGRKAIHPDIHPPQIAGLVSGRPLPDAAVVQLSAEHATLELGTQSQDLRIGDKIELIPGYSDHTTPLHTHLYGMRGDRVESVWPIAARGCLQ